MSEAPSQVVPAHVVKESIAAAVRTEDQLIVGLLHARPSKRLKDELNHNSDHYIAVTDARVYDAAGTALLYEASFLLIANPHIVSVTPLVAVAAGVEAAWAGLLRSPRPNP